MDNFQGPRGPCVAKPKAGEPLLPCFPTVFCSAGVPCPGLQVSSGLLKQVRSGMRKGRDFPEKSAKMAVMGFGSQDLCVHPCFCAPQQPPSLSPSPRGRRIATVPPTAGLCAHASTVWISHRWGALFPPFLALYMLEQAWPVHHVQRDKHTSTTKPALRH